MVKNTYKVGDKIIELGNVFQIFKVNKVINKDGVLERIIFYRPYFKSDYNSSLICSIPTKNIEFSKIRRPISLKILNKLILMFDQKKIDIRFGRNDDLKEFTNSNDPADTVGLITYLKKQKSKDPNKFSISKNYMLKTAIEKLVQEFALVGKTSLEEARSKITAALL